MRKRSSKPNKPTDINQMAASIVSQATGDEPRVEPPAKNPNAVALGRKGGLKGGPARAKKLGKKKLVTAARKAAAARWKRK